MNCARLHAAILASIVPLCLALPAVAISQHDYVESLGALRQAILLEIPRAQHGEIPATIAVRRAANVLQGVRVVQTPANGPLSVDDSLLLHSLDAAEHSHPSAVRVAHLTQIAGQLSALEGQIESGSGSESASVSPKTALDDVLSDSAYGYDPLPAPSWMDRLADRINRWLNRLTGRPVRPAPDISFGFIRTIIWVIAGGLFVLVIVLLVRYLQRRVGRPTLLALDETETALMQARDTDSLEALAERHARSGDHRRAFRMLYLATLVALDSGGVLRFDRSKTNWEYLRQLRAAGYDDVVRRMVPLTRDFDRVWYGLEQADAAHYSRARAEFDSAVAAARQRRAQTQSSAALVGR